MDYNVDLKIELPEKLIETAGINEDCIFKSYIEDEIIHVKIYDKEDTKVNHIEAESDNSNCPFICPCCGKHLINE